MSSASSARLSGGEMDRDSLSEQVKEMYEYFKTATVDADEIEEVRSETSSIGSEAEAEAVAHVQQNLAELMQDVVKINTALTSLSEASAKDNEEAVIAKEKSVEIHEDEDSYDKIERYNLCLACI